MGKGVDGESRTKWRGPTKTQELGKRVIGNKLNCARGSRARLTLIKLEEATRLEGKESKSDLHLREEVANESDPYSRGASTSFFLMMLSTQKENPRQNRKRIPGIPLI